MLYKEYRKDSKLLRIYYDDTPDNPREWDNLGTMVCFHRRYDLGDKHDYGGPDEFVLELLEKHFNDYSLAFEFIVNAKDYSEAIELLKRDYVILPLYLYDHGGITISTGPFSCPWDSGQVGWIYCSKDRFREETGYSEEELFIQGKAEEMLQAEVKEYDDYLVGNVFGYKVYSVEKCECCGEEKLIEEDSCWGFYGNNFAFNGLLDCVGKEWEDVLA